MGAFDPASIAALRRQCRLELPRGGAAKSPADFIARMSIVEEEADESLFWMAMIMERNLLNAARIRPLYDEGNEILSIVVASIKTARKRGQK